MSIFWFLSVTPHYPSESTANRMNAGWQLRSNAVNPDLEIPNLGECNEHEIAGIT